MMTWKKFYQEFFNINIDANIDIDQEEGIIVIPKNLRISEVLSVINTKIRVVVDLNPARRRSLDLDECFDENGRIPSESYTCKHASAQLTGAKPITLLEILLKYFKDYVEGGVLPRDYRVAGGTKNTTFKKPYLPMIGFHNTNTPNQYLSIVVVRSDSEGIDECMEYVLI